MFFRDPDRTILRKLYDFVRMSHTITNANTTRMETALMTMMEDVKTEMAKLGDAVKAIVAVADQLKAAYDYIKTHPKVVEVTKEDPELANVLAQASGLTKSLSDEVAKVNVSGSV